MEQTATYLLGRIGERIPNGRGPSSENRLETNTGKDDKTLGRHSSGIDLYIVKSRLKCRTNQAIPKRIKCARKRVLRHRHKRHRT